jgi:hypothetical protein
MRLWKPHDPGVRACLSLSGITSRTRQTHRTTEPWALERPLQTLIERNMEALFGVRLVASEHSSAEDA